MKVGRALLVAGVAAGAGAGLRLAHARHERILHPDGRSFTGCLQITGRGEPTGAALLDRPDRHPVTVRISKGAGTWPGWPDVLGVALRVHGPVAGHRTDLLFSTAGRGRFSKHLPTLRRSFDTGYGTITSYRTGTGRKLYLSVTCDPDSTPLGRTLESVVAAAAGDGARLLLTDGAGRVLGRVTFGQLCPASTDDALAFDPGNAPADLHPSGLVHASRCVTYKWARRWRGQRA
ncbi:hypothetical protein [Actinoplanes sp. N902-109]|uniref:hypothetical protein n=1 Tax=Actinoplanes sp. (strain N902-109) TaxID=649831 RepID=UPI0003294161|nr:hypothetical protein [Actinoplanes sp. N902-109]AGL19675.1 putative phosphodiesterase [Actinoplanes sp. N902-109]